MTDPISGITAAMPIMAATAQPFAASAPAPGAPAPALQIAASLHAVADALGEAFQPAQTDLHFQVDKVTGQMVISVIDAQDGKTLLQIPGEEALAIAQSLEQLQAQLLQRTA